MESSVHNQKKDFHLNLFSSGLEGNMMLLENCRVRLAVCALRPAWSWRGIHTASPSWEGAQQNRVPMTQKTPDRLGILGLEALVETKKSCPVIWGHKGKASTYHAGCKLSARNAADEKLLPVKGYSLSSVWLQVLDSNRRALCCEGPKGAVIPTKGGVSILKF